MIQGVRPVQAARDEVEYTRIYKVTSIGGGKVRVDCNGMTQEYNSMDDAEIRVIAVLEAHGYRNASTLGY